MSRLILCVVCGGIVAFAAGSAWAEGKAAPGDTDKEEDPNHQELRAVRDAAIKAVNDDNLDALLKYVHPNVVVIWQNGEISRGHKGVRDYHDKVFNGPNAPLKEYKVDSPEMQELSILYGGNTALSWGTMKSRFVFKSGRTMEVTSPWSATLVKEDGKWLIAEYHASVGLFDNPVVGEMVRWMYWVGGIAAIAGIVVGALLVSLLRRPKKA